MQLQCNRKQLNEALQHVQGAVSANSTIPALEGILFSASDGTLTLTGYNMEMGITTSLPVAMGAPGRMLLPAKTFIEIVRRLPGDEITLESNQNHQCRIQCGAAQFSLAGMASEDFPELPQITGGNSFSFHSELLDNMVRMTRFAAAKDENNPVYTGILWELSEGCVTMVAMDGWRLAIRQEAITNAIEAKFIVPEKTLSEVLRLLPGGDTPITVQVSFQHILFQIGEVTVISRLIGGEFFDYQTAVPKDSTTCMTIDTHTLLESIDRVSLVVSERLRVAIKCFFCNDALETTCESPIGRASDKITGEMEGEELEIGFNSRYLLEALRVIECDRVRLEMSGPLSPLRIKPLEGENFIFLVLPVRLK